MEVRRDLQARTEYSVASSGRLSVLGQPNSQPIEPRLSGVIVKTWLARSFLPVAPTSKGRSAVKVLIGLQNRSIT